MNNQPGEFIDIATAAWASNPMADPSLVEVRDNVRRSVGIALRTNTGRGDGKVIAASWVGTALALVDSLDLEDLREYVNVLPPAFARALEAASVSARIADHKGLDRDWLARNMAVPADEPEQSLRAAISNTLDGLNPGMLHSEKLDAVIAAISSVKRG